MKLMLDSKEQTPVTFQGYEGVLDVARLPVGNYSIPGFKDSFPSRGALTTAIHQTKYLRGHRPRTPRVYRFGGRRRGRKRNGRVNALPLRTATCGGAQVALHRLLILCPGAKQNSKKRRGGSIFDYHDGSFFGFLSHPVARKSLSSE
jgi:hypothetical protein